MPARRPRTRFAWPLSAIVAIVATAIACGTNNPDNGSGGGGGGGSGSSSGSSGVCRSGDEGCACSTAGQQAACGKLVTTSGSYVTCSEGYATCTNGVWGPCIGNTIVEKGLNGVSLGQGGIRPQYTSGPCTNVCDPNPDCTGLIGQPSDVDAAGVYPAPEGGVTLGYGEAGTTTCTGLQCFVVKCAAGVSTTITGVVYDPAGVNPLYNATVYIPLNANGQIPSFTAGVTCDQCTSAVPTNAVAVTTTATDGSFTLTNVPSGAGLNIPIVVQMGKWRREIMLTNVTSCTNNTAANNCTASPASLCTFRLPANKTDGYNYNTGTYNYADLPQMALVTGAADPLECILLKAGISLSEFSSYTGSNSSAKVHMYESDNAPGSYLDPNYGADVNGSTLWLDTTCTSSACNTVSAPHYGYYDVVLDPCEGAAINKENLYTQHGGGEPYGNLINYTSAGGRAFITHFGYVWLEYPSHYNYVTGADNWSGLAAWTHLTGTTDTQDPLTASIVTTLNSGATFPKGVAFGQWLLNVNASTTIDQLTIHEGRQDLGGAPTSLNTNVQAWMTATDTAVSTNQSYVPHFTFNTPITSAASAQCGRLVYSDFHVSANALVSGSGACTENSQCGYGQTCTGHTGVGGTCSEPCATSADCHDSTYTCSGVTVGQCLPTSCKAGAPTYACATGLYCNLAGSPSPNCQCTNDNECLSGKCVSAGQTGCTGTTCTGSGAADASSCQLNAVVGCNETFSCSDTRGTCTTGSGNCTMPTSGVSPLPACTPGTYTCTLANGTAYGAPNPLVTGGPAANTECWCTSDSQCGSLHCVNNGQAGCTGTTCTGTTSAGWSTTTGCQNDSTQTCNIGYACSDTHYTGCTAAKVGQPCPGVVTDSTVPSPTSTCASYGNYATVPNATDTVCLCTNWNQCPGSTASCIDIDGNCTPGNSCESTGSGIYYGANGCQVYAAPLPSPGDSCTGDATRSTNSKDPLACSGTTCNLCTSNNQCLQSGECSYVNGVNCGGATDAIGCCEEYPLGTSPTGTPTWDTNSGQPGLPYVCCDGTQNHSQPYYCPGYGTSCPAAYPTCYYGSVNGNYGWSCAKVSGPFTCSTGTPNSSDTACICNNNNQCNSGVCANNGQSGCTSGTCTGAANTGGTDGCVNTCSTSPLECATGAVNPAGTACWCTNNNQCASGTCVTWSGCTGNNCSASGTAETSPNDHCTASVFNVSPSAPTCPNGYDYESSTSSCWCSTDNECPTGACINQGQPSCTTSTCTGTGTPDTHSCAPSEPTCVTTAGGTCPLSINGNVPACNATPNCACNNDNECPGSKCVCASTNCTGVAGTGVTVNDLGCIEPTQALPAIKLGTASCTTPAVCDPLNGTGQCWCTSDSECANDTCVTWADCAGGACSGAAGTAFDTHHCASTGPQCSGNWTCPSGHVGACDNNHDCACANNSECATGLCVNLGQAGCTGTTCTGSASSPYNDYDCQEPNPLQLPVACTETIPYSCTSGTCNAAGTACLCNADNQCPSGQCIPTTVNGVATCTSATCSGTGAGDAASCVPSTVTNCSSPPPPNGTNAQCGGTSSVELCSVAGDAGGGPGLGQCQKACTANSQCGGGETCVAGFCHGCNTSANCYDRVYPKTCNGAVGSQTGQCCGNGSPIPTSTCGLNSSLFPEACLQAPLSDQEKALEFMFFDLTSCVTPDTGSASPPVLLVAETFPLDFVTTCPIGTIPRWREFDYTATIPPAAAGPYTATYPTPSIDFAAQTGPANGDGGGFVPSTPLQLGSPVTTSGSGAILLDTAPGGTGLFTAAGITSQTDLRMWITLTPTANQLSSPVLNSWEAQYDCPASE